MEATAIAVVDRVELRAEIMRTRAAFQRCVGQFSEAEWKQPVADSKWTGRQLLHHVTWALEQLPKEVASAARGKGMFNYPKLLSDTGSLWLVKWEARNETRESILRRYDVAIDAVLQSLERVSDQDWQRGARFYGERFYSVEDLFHTVAGHFDQHCGQLS